jgi:hypothetical protein
MPLFNFLPSVSCKLLYQLTEVRKENMHSIEVMERPTKVYEVQIAYYNIDSHNDKPSFDEPDVWRVLVPSVSNINAIQTALHIVQISRAEIMTAFIPFDMGKHELTLDEIEQIRQEAEDKNVFKSWLDIEPTSIQCTLKDDVETLKNMTISNLSKQITDIGSMAEDYLKELDKDA